MMSDIYITPWGKTPFNIVKRSKYIEPLTKIIFAHEKIWKEPQHKHYTMHGKEHVENILSFLSKWLYEFNFKGTEGSEEVAQASLFILLGAIYLHDIGMQCSHGEFQKKYLGEDLSKHKNGLNEWRNLEKIRKHHQLLSYLMIIDSQKPIQNTREYPSSLFTLGSLNFQKEMEAIALLSASHADIDITTTNYFQNDIKQEIRKKINRVEKGSKEYAEYEVRTGIKINLKKLMVILRIGDASDASYERIDFERLNKENIWEKLFSIKDPLALDFLFHILKHYFVDGPVNIDEHYTIGFKYRFPKRLEKDKKLQDYLVTIAEYPLRRNLNLYKQKAYLPLPSLLKGHRILNHLKHDLLKDMETQLGSDGYKRLLKLIEKGAKEMASIDLRDSIKIANNKIWILGQNGRFVADPSRATNRAREKDEFYKLFSEKLNDKNFEIKMLIYNPKERWNQISKWHNKMIETWFAQSEEERGEHRNYPPDFVEDLKFSFRRFKKWQKNLSSLGDRFLVKCYTPRKNVASRNLIDPDDPFGLIQITQSRDGTHPDPLSRSSEQMIISTELSDSFKNAVNEYGEYLYKALDIKKIKNVDWDKLSSYVIKIDLVKKICESLAKTKKIQKWLSENISRLQSVINRIPGDDEYYKEFINKKGELEKILNEFLSC